jgi:hypothetical protein
MVRLEERPWRAAATLVVDTRGTAHLIGAGTAGSAGDPAPPTDTLEWVVEAAASIGTHLLHRGAGLRVIADTGDLGGLGARGAMNAHELLDRLAELSPSRLGRLDLAVDALRRSAGDGPAVCLLGLAGPDDVAPLVRARSGPGTDVAVLIDAASWLDAGALRGRRPLSAGARADVLEQQDGAVRLLRAAGWQVLAARPDQSIEQVWSELGLAGSEGATGWTGAQVPV